MIPPVRFAAGPGGSVAWQGLGDDERALVVVPPLAQNIEKMWEQPAFWRPVRRLASAVRFVHYDKLGTGASDPVREPATLEERVAELAAVLDAAGLGRAWLLGLSEGGIIALAAAARMPERVIGLVLVNTTSGAGARPAPDRHGPVRSRAETHRYFEAVAARWATPASLVLWDFAPSLRWVPGIGEWMGAYERASASPAMIGALLASSLQLDATPLLPRVRQPALVIHMAGDRVIPPPHGRALAAALPHARLVEVEGADHFAWVSIAVDTVIDEILAAMGAAGRGDGSYRGLTPWDTLTTAERRVVRLVQRGLTNGETARSAGTSVRTVEAQLSRIYAKLGVRSRTELAIRAED